MEVRRTLIAANWKMHKTIGEAEDFVREFLPYIVEVGEVDIVLCPPFTSLSVLQQALKGSQVKLGGQDVFWEKQGAYTGEISPTMLKDLDCRYVIIGHSERRQLMGESNLHINRKLKAATEAGLIPILCVGETLPQRQKNQAQAVVRQQLEEGLLDIPAADLVIAYEPIWAIGTGINASPADAQEMNAFIRELMKNIYGEQEAERIKILYGGSVKPDNITQFTAEADVDGALVGGASLNAADLARIVRLNLNV